MHNHTALSPQDTRQQVSRVLWITLVLNLTVAGAKIVIGIMSGALAITADGFHSLTDGLGNVLALAASRIAAKPPDAEHPYGHRRFETLAALGIAALLAFTAYEIVTQAIEQLRDPTATEVSPLMFVVMIGTLIINIGVSEYERREGRRLKAEILIADASHTRADIFVTISVLISLILTAFGASWADPLVSLLIVALIARAAYGVFKQTAGVLVDRAPLPAEAIEQTAAAVPGVERVIRVRSRGTEDAVFIDVDAEVAPEMTTDHSAAIAGAIRDQMMAQFGGVQEVEVHFEPARAARPDYALTARARADALGLSTHAVHVSEDGKQLEMHVEVPAGQTLAEAHEQVTQLEQAIRSSFPELDNVVTHIEPAEAAPVTGDGLPSAPVVELTEQASVLLHTHFSRVGWHDIQVTADGDVGCAITAHAAMPAETALEDAHLTAEAAERMLRTEMPALQRVTIHTEPVEP